MIGGFGTAEVFSFHATKFVNCGEGGAIVTSDDDFAARVRQMRSFGLGGCDHVVSVGTNGKMSEFAAVVGLSSLESMDEFIQINQRNYYAYCRVLAGFPGIHVLRYDEAERNNYQYVVLQVNEDESPLTRDQWLQVLHAENVLARRYFYPGVHRMEPYCAIDPAVASRLPATEAVLRGIMVLPSGTAVETSDIELIGRIFGDATTVAARLSHQLPRILPLPTVPLAPLEQEAA